MIESYADDNLVILIDGGHTEYSPIYVPDFKVNAISMENDFDEPIHNNIALALTLAESPNNWLTPGDPEDASWTTLLRLSGTFHVHLASFTLTAATLTPSLDPTGYTPGGDDDYYDYYPSGLRMLREWACDLDEAAKAYTYADHYTKPGFLGVYHNVLKDFLRREKGRFDQAVEHTTWDHMEEVEERINELAKDLNMPRHAIIEMI
jgi:hypothetical protein